LYGLLRDFGSRFSNVEKIHRQIIAAERLSDRPQWWKQLGSRLWNYFTSECDRILAFMSNLDENEVVDVASSALGATLAVHKAFKERNHINSAVAIAPMSVQQSRIKERRRRNGAAAAASAPPQILTPPLNAPNAIETSSNSLPPAASAAVTAQFRDKSLSRISPVASVETASAAGVFHSGSSITSRLRRRTESVELEEVVVQRGCINANRHKLAVCDGSAVNVIDAAASNPEIKTGPVKVVEKESDSSHLKAVECASAVNDMQFTAEKLTILGIEPVTEVKYSDTKSTFSENPKLGEKFSLESGHRILPEYMTKLHNSRIPSKPA
jgi:hypothetical protein